MQSFLVSIANAFKCLQVKCIQVQLKKTGCRCYGFLYAILPSLVVGGIALFLGSLKYVLTTLQHRMLTALICLLYLSD